MNKKDPQSVLTSATVYVAIIVCAVLYENWQNGTTVRQTSLAFFLLAGLFLAYQWAKLLLNKRKDK